MLFKFQFFLFFLFYFFFYQIEKCFPELEMEPGLVLIYLHLAQLKNCTIEDSKL